MKFFAIAKRILFVSLRTVDVFIAHVCASFSSSICLSTCPKIELWNRLHFIISNQQFRFYITLLLKQCWHHRALHTISVIPYLTVRPRALSADTAKPCSRHYVTFGTKKGARDTRFFPSTASPKILLDPVKDSMAPRPLHGLYRLSSNQTYSVLGKRFECIKILLSPRPAAASHPKRHTHASLTEAASFVSWHLRHLSLQTAYRKKEISPNCNASINYSVSVQLHPIRGYCQENYWVQSKPTVA